MGNRSTITRIFSLFAVLVVIRSADAERIIGTSDTESLSVHAGLIVEATLEDHWAEQSRYEGPIDVWHVRVEDVIAGPKTERDRREERPPTTRPTPVKAGVVIAVAGFTIRPYRVTVGLPKKDAEKSGRLLQNGDRVTLFLSRSGDGFQGPLICGATSAEWGVPDNGLRFHEGDNTYPFIQHRGEEAITSQFITATPEVFPDFRPLSRADLRKRIDEALKREPVVSAFIEKATVNDFARLTEIGREGRKTLPGEISSNSYWASCATGKADEIGDPQNIVANFLFAADGPGKYNPQQNFCERADCRETLLALFEAKQISAERKVAAAEALEWGAGGYREQLKQAADKGQPLPHEGRFAQRLSAIALTELDMRVFRPLMNAVRDCAPSGEGNASHVLDADLAAAAKMLDESLKKEALERRGVTIQTLLVIQPTTKPAKS